MDNAVMAKIRQRRLQVLVHSCIYYEYNTNIISDSQWSKWAQELVQLQKEYPVEAQAVDWAKDFKDFDGSTGMDLPIHGPWVTGKAVQLLHYKGEIPYGAESKEGDYYLPEKPVAKQSTIKRRKLF